MGWFVLAGIWFFGFCLYGMQTGLDPDWCGKIMVPVMAVLVVIGLFRTLGTEAILAAF